MVRHVILWTLKETYSLEKKKIIIGSIKVGLEGLKGVIPGLIEITVHTTPLESSNCDVMLDSLFEDQEALKEYATHPAHVDIANEMVRPFMANRTCMDYEV